MKVAAIIDLIVSHHRVGELDKAISLGLEALKLHPGEPDLHFNLGLGYFLKSDYEQSKTHFIQVLRIQPTHEEALAFLHEITGQDVS